MSKSLPTSANLSLKSARDNASESRKQNVMLRSKVGDWVSLPTSTNLPKYAQDYASESRKLNVRLRFKVGDWSKMDKFISFPSLCVK